MVETRFPESGLTSEYGSIILTSVTEVVTLEVTFDGDVILTENYSPDVSGVVEIKDMGKLALAYMTKLPLSLSSANVYNYCELEINITENTSPETNINKTVGFYRSDFDFSGSISAELLLKMPLSRATTKNAFASAREFLSFFDDSTGDINLYVVYKKDGRDTGLTINDFISVGDGLVLSAEVSPSVVATAAECSVSDLISYSVYKDSTAIIRYLVDHRVHQHLVTFVFRNGFGAQESITCISHVDTEAKWTREMGVFDSNILQVSREKEEENRVRTGYLHPSMVGVVDDLLHSEEVYVIENNALKSVVILSEDFNTTTVKNQPRAYQFSYRYTSSHPQAGKYTPLARAGIFDETFDDTFE